MSDSQQSSTTPTFRDTLEIYINRHNMEAGSDTPDFILADYLVRCLEAFDIAVKHRENWYERGPKPSETKLEVTDNFL